MKRKHSDIITNDELITNLMKQNVNIHTLLFVYFDLKKFDRHNEITENVMEYIIEKKLHNCSFIFGLFHLFRNYISIFLEKLNKNINIEYVIKILNHFEIETSLFDFEKNKKDCLICLYMFANYNLYKNQIIPEKHFDIISDFVDSFSFSNEILSNFYINYFYKLIKDKDIKYESLGHLLRRHIHLSRNEKIIQIFLNYHHISTTSNQEEKIEEDCFICFTKLEKNKKYNFHCHQNISYCLECIITWIQKSDTCCMCRKKTCLKI